MWLFLLIIFLSATYHTSTDIYLPALLPMAQSLHAPISSLQLTIAVFMLGGSIAQLIYGPLSDIFGRRKLLIFGLVIGTCASLICAMAPNTNVLLVGRFLQAIGIGAAAALIRPILRDLFNDYELAKYGSYSSFISVLFLSHGPILGGMIYAYFGWRAIFLYLFLCMLLFTCITYVFFPETNKNISKNNFKLKSIQTNVSQLISSPTFVYYSLCCGLCYGAILAWLTAGSVILQETLKLNPIQCGIIYMLTGYVFGLGSIVNSLLVKRYGINQMMYTGISLLCLSSVLMGCFCYLELLNMWTTMAPAMLLTFGCSMILPNSFAGAFRSFSHIAGMAAALFGAFQMAGGLTVSTLISMSTCSQATSMASACLMCSLLSLFSIMKIRALATIHPIDGTQPTIKL